MHFHQALIRATQLINYIKNRNFRNITMLKKVWKPRRKQVCATPRL